MAREVGRVVRTAQLLRYLSDPAMRRRVTTATNKVEAYNGFSQWLHFGNRGVIVSRARLTPTRPVPFAADLDTFGVGGALLGDVGRLSAAPTLVVVLGLALSYGGVVGVAVVSAFPFGIGWLWNLFEMIIWAPSAVMGAKIMIMFLLTFASNGPVRTVISLVLLSRPPIVGRRPREKYRGNGCLSIRTTSCERRYRTMCSVGRWVADRLAR